MAKLLHIFYHKEGTFSLLCQQVQYFTLSKKSTVLNNFLNTMDFYDISSNGLYLFLSSICFFIIFLMMLNLRSWWFVLLFLY